MSYVPGRRVVRPPARSTDRRFGRPYHRVVRNHPSASFGRPAWSYYRPYYARWWVHPYYRATYATNCVVGFGFGVSPWDVYWSPPVRPGWTWVAGAWNAGVWWPGYWQPAAPAPVQYVYERGFWDGDTYVEGFNRRESRNDGDWAWVEGYYLDDGTFVRGHWQPTGQPPRDGYVWEPGFWDGETWVDGFWRPELRADFRWVGAYYDEDGVFHTGYWVPIAEQLGQVWVPGWFDGNAWVDGYWVEEQRYLQEDVQGWTPEEGWDDGWREGEIFGDVIDVEPGFEPNLPLGLPIDPSTGEQVFD